MPTGPRSAHDAARGSETTDAYRARAERAGSQAALLAGERSWTPQRRFDRAFERLALPRFARGPRFELLVLLGRLGVFEFAASSLQLGHAQDPTVAAAKRVFGIGDPILLQRRAVALASAAQAPIEALDLALLNWARPPGERFTAGTSPVVDEMRRAAIARTLGVAA